MNYISDWIIMAVVFGIVGAYLLAVHYMIRSDDQANTTVKQK